MIIGIYAPKPGMGASTLARNLALLASKKTRVLLVELDYYYPSSALVLKASHDQRNLEACVADYTKKRKTWHVLDYTFDTTITRKNDWPKKLAVLLPSGKKGFEYFPNEPETFVKDVIRQAKDAGFQDVILDIPAHLDSHFSVQALRSSDVVVTLFNNSFSVSQTYIQRLSAMETNELTFSIMPVLYVTRKGMDVRAVYQSVFSSEDKYVARFPYDHKQIRNETYCTSKTSYAYHKAMKRLINALAEKEQTLEKSKGVANGTQSVSAVHSSNN